MPVALTVAVLLLFPAAAGACGMPIGATVPSEQALVTFADGREEIVASLALEDAGADAAVVFPVPADAEVDVLEGEEDLFGYLANVTTLDEDEGAGGGPAVTGAAPRSGGVEVVGREVIGGYDVARLRAGDPAALQTYLDDNGFQTPAGAGPILADYVADGWSYVAIKLAEETAAGQLRPLRIAFPSEEIVYPKRLDALAEEPVATTIYVLADRRVEHDAMSVEYEGPVDELAAAPPPEFAALFARAPHLTKLSSSTLTDEQLQEDFVFRVAGVGAAPADGPRRGGSDESPWRTYVVGGLLGLAVLLMLRRAARWGQK